MKTITVVFRNLFQDVKIPPCVDLVYDKGHDGVIFQMEKPKRLRGKQLVIKGSEEDLKKALDYWEHLYKVELFTSL